MQIFVKTLTNKTITVKVEPTDLVSVIMNQIYQSQGIPPDIQVLSLSGQHLYDSDKVNNLGSYLLNGKTVYKCIQDGSTLHLYLRLKGGGQSIKFNSMNQPFMGKFTKSAPDWRTIGQGLNLEGICKKKGCISYNQKVWIQKGFGKFNMSKEVYKSSCPICKELCEQVLNMALYQANSTSKGRIKGEKMQKEIKNSQTKKDQFLTFKDEGAINSQWLYLQIDVTKL